MSTKLHWVLLAFLTVSSAFLTMVIFPTYDCAIRDDGSRCIRFHIYGIHAWTVSGSLIAGWGLESTFFSRSLGILR